MNRGEEGGSNYTNVRPGSSTGQYPSRDLQDLLAKLGTLDSRHERLREEVDLLRVQTEFEINLTRFRYLFFLSFFKHELNNNQSQPMRLPDDFGQKMDDIKKIKASLDELIKNFNIVNINN